MLNKDKNISLKKKKSYLQQLVQYAKMIAKKNIFYFFKS